MLCTCLCGAVTLTVPAPREMDACHCGMCRRWGGGPLLAVHCGSDVQVAGAEHVTVYKSSDWAERAFCKQCGTHLYYRLVGSNDHMLPAGLLPEGTELPFTTQIFIDKKPANYAFANKTTNLTEAEVFAKYAPPQ